MHIDFFIPLWIVRTLEFIILAPTVSFLIVMIWLGFPPWESNRTTPRGELRADNDYGVIYPNGFPRGYLKAENEFTRVELEAFYSRPDIETERKELLREDVLRKRKEFRELWKSNKETPSLIRQVKGDRR